MGLTEKQEKFIECLLSGMTDRQAYYVAYPKSKKWKENSVDNKACLLKQNVKVRQRLQKARERMEKRTEITPQKIMTELDRLSSYNMADVYDEFGNAKPINQLPRELTAAIVKVDTFIDKEGVRQWRYTFANKDKSLQLLAQIKGMLQGKEQEDNKQPINIVIDYGDKQ